MALSENKQKMLRGELYHAFTPELIAERDRCARALKRYNSASASEVSRRRLVELWRDVLGDKTPLPPKKDNQEEDDKLFENEPIILSPIVIDYGTNVRVGPGAFINFNCTILDTCLVTVGARTLIGPNVSLYSGTHPLDPELRNGTQGPELGKEIHIGEDCWIGGNVVVLPGVRLGRGCVVGAGSVVTRDVPDFHVVAGNPARVLRKIETRMDPKQSTTSEEAKQEGAEKPMGEMNGTT
ncbi:hypothetical protein H2201_002928 [Coniosporium apollinis]|uniref:Maltose/galactoside acetyltransferase domain-containing protein n=2 Tax=Coniosporium TaxID=2810619 RepID=A0ABQ9NYP9_9PEZI|nr:hypothetical protein H2199_006444 [Cladosporium sp. JES 115]KAJ9667093.1 hypothetical protein H2201_002928 [Coniosporium apollinis]